jgi:hypothetical protein
MPLKRWMTAHGLPAWYSWLAVVGLTVLSNLLTLLVVLNLAGNAVENERAAREESAAQARASGEINRRAFCLVVMTQEEVFQESTTPVGVKAREAWHDLGEIFRCEE